jgi:hypothetical protein
MAGIYDSPAVREFIAFGLRLIGKLGEFQDLEGPFAVNDDINELQLQLGAAESALQDDAVRKGVEPAGFVLSASLAVAQNLKIRFDFFCLKLHDVHQAQEFKTIVDTIWTHDNLKELGQRLSSIRAALM